MFSNGEEQVNYYGGMGMPTIVVVGTNEHKVFFKSIGYTSAIDDQIRQAIDSALLYNPSGVGEKIASDGFRIYPTLFTDRINIETGKEFNGAEIVIFDAYGRQVLEIPRSGKRQNVAPGHRFFKGHLHSAAEKQRRLICRYQAHLPVNYFILN